jgi:hypothetical protein
MAVALLIPRSVGSPPMPVAPTEPGGKGVAPDAPDAELISAIVSLFEAKMAPLIARTEREFGRLATEARAFIAEQRAEFERYKAAIAMQEIEQRKRNDDEIMRLREAMALVKDGAPGPEGPPGRDGRDGVGLAGALIDRTGSLLVTMSDGTVRELGPVIGRDGAPGRDGLSFDAFELDFEQVDARTLRAKWTNAAGKEQVREYRFPVPIHCGYHEEGKSYEAGDAVSFGGTTFLAKTLTAQKPELDNPKSDWVILAKKGRDSRHGKSAYDLACEKGFKGSLDDWLNSLRGPPGKDGKLAP